MYWHLNDVLVTEHVNLPVDWKSMSPSGRIFVEIGFGNGEFLEYLARTYPDVLIVGIDVAQLCASKGARLAMAENLSNIRVMHGDARFLLRHCFAPESAERVYMNFPCPWPKARHAQRRVTVPLFADLLNYLLVPGGTFELATDVDWYAQEAAETITANGAFDAEPIVTNPERPYVTKYERKWKAMGKDTWLLVLKKNGRIRPETTGEDDWPMEEELATKKTPAEVMAQLKGAEGPGVGGCGHWVMRESFLSDDGVGLMLVITADEGFEQHFYLKLVQKPRGGVTLKVDSVGHPYRTPAMRAALLYALDAVR